tara:strand:- start:953 stop:1426 length:474 start_codon:yes stop_codon:yes gene_type:complete
MDPITISAAVAGATTAFNSIKQMIAAGKDLESCIGDVSRWMRMASDVDNAAKQSKNPPIFKKLFAAGSVEEEALASYAAKKKLEAQRQELKTFLNMSYGPQAWADLIRLEGKIRRQRQEAIYKQQELKRQILEGIAIAMLALLCLGLLAVMFWFLRR